MALTAMISVTVCFMAFHGSSAIQLKPSRIGFHKLPQSPLNQTVRIELKPEVLCLMVGAELKSGTEKYFITYNL